GFALGQSENEHRVRSDDGDVLLAVFTLIAHRVRVGVFSELGDPEFLAGLGIDGAEAIVRRRADEHETARRRNGAGTATAAGILFGWRQSLGNANHRLPSNVARVCVDRVQAAPRRFLTGPVSYHLAIRALHRSAEAKVGARAVDASPVRQVHKTFMASAVHPPRPFLL